MAMNKAERELLHSLRVQAALSWPQFEEPEPVSAAEIEAASASRRRFRGWWVNVSRGVGHMVGPGVVDNYSHANHGYTDAELDVRYGEGRRVSLSQGQGGPWYHSKGDALRAGMWALCRRRAEELAAVLARIEAEGEGR